MEALPEPLVGFMKCFLSSPRSLLLLRAARTEGHSFYDAQTGAAETSNGKWKIRNEKQQQPKFQMAVKKNFRRVTRVPAGDVLEICIFKFACLQHENDKVTVSRRFIPFSSASDNPVHYLFIFPSCSVFLSSP